MVQLHPHTEQVLVALTVDANSPAETTVTEFCTALEHLVRGAKQAEERASLNFAEAAKRGGLAYAMSWHAERVVAAEWTAKFWRLVLLEARKTASVAAAKGKGRELVMAELTASSRTTEPYARANSEVTRSVAGVVLGTLQAM